MRKMIATAMAAVFLLLFCGCGPSGTGTVTTDTSVVSDEGGSAGNPSVTESLGISSQASTLRSSKTSTQKTSRASQAAKSSVSRKTSRLPSKTASTKSSAKPVSSSSPVSSRASSDPDLSVPPELQKIWNSLTDKVTEDEKTAYRKYMKEKGYHFDENDDSNFFVLYTFDNKPYYVIAFDDNNCHIEFDRATKRHMSATPPNDVSSKNAYSTRLRTELESGTRLYNVVAPFKLQEDGWYEKLSDGSRISPEEAKESAKSQHKTLIRVWNNFLKNKE